jgi:RNA polymerase sigma-70 factor (ECF subfamily)
MNLGRRLPLPRALEATVVTPSEFDRRFGLARGRLEAICGSLVGMSEAADVVHDVYVTARTRLHQLRDADRLEAWLARITVNECYELHRRRRRLSGYPIAVLEAPAGSSGDVALRELIERLPPRDRTVLVLHYGHGYGLDEIADLLGIKYATVRSVIARTRQKLFREWTEADR